MVKDGGVTAALTFSHFTAMYLCIVVCSRVERSLKIQSRQS